MTKPDLAALSEAATLGPWEIDTLKSEGSYGTGDDTTEGFEVSAIYDAKGRALFDALNSDLIEVHEDYADEDGYSLAHDLTSSANAAFIVALVNAYRSGDLVLIDRETVAQQLDRDQRTIHTRGSLNRKLSRVLKAHIEHGNSYQ